MSGTDKAPRSANNEGGRRPSSNNRRRRPPTSNAPRRPRPQSSSSEPAKETEEAPRRERPPRPEPTPVPESSYGKKEIGTVISVIRKGKYNFGFIVFGKDPKPEDNGPRVYFNPSYIVEPNLYLRRGYIVEFTVDKDEEGRAIAKDIKLTEEGVTRKAEADEAAAKRRAERQQNEGGEEGGNEAPRRRRSGPKRRGPRPEGKKINLRVTVEGKSGEKTIEFDSAQTIGKLKNIAVTATEAPVEYVVYHNNEFLTKAAFNALQDNDVIHLAPQQESK